MATYTNLNDLFTGIADAIRSKNGSTAMIVADTFPTEIDNLRTGFDYENHDVVSIPDYAFYGCTDLRNVNCYNVTNIGESAFEGCINLQTIVLYNGVKSVGKNTFKDCDNVIIYYEGSSIPETWNKDWNPNNRPVIYGKLIETWDVSATEEDNVIAELYANGNEYTLFINGNGNMMNYSEASSPPWRSSYETNITSVLIDNGVTNIGNYAFRSCQSLTSINIPDGITHIGSMAFHSCTSLTSITIPDGVASINTSTFSHCFDLTSITIPTSIITIWGSALYNCSNLTSIIYAGTIAQWNAITFRKSSVFDFNWDHNTGNYIIHCTDGDIAKDGTITYHST